MRNPQETNLESFKSWLIIQNYAETLTKSLSKKYNKSIPQIL